MPLPVSLRKSLMDGFLINCIYQIQLIICSIAWCCLLSVRFGVGQVNSRPNPVQNSHNLGGSCQALLYFIRGFLMRGVSCMFVGEASHSILACLFPALVQEPTNKFPYNLDVLEYKSKSLSAVLLPKWASSLLLKIKLSIEMSDHGPGYGILRDSRCS